MDLALNHTLSFSSEKERFNQSKSCYKSANMSKKCNSSLSSVRKRNKTIDDLKNNPESEYYKSRKTNDTNEIDNGNNGKDFRLREEQKICTENTRDSTRCTDLRNSRVWTNEDLCQSCNNTSNDIKKYKSDMPHSILNIVPKYPKIEHISNQVHPSAMEKHGSEYGKPNGKENERFNIVPYRYFIRDATITIYKRDKIITL